FDLHDLISRPRPVLAWEAFQTSRRLQGKTNTADPRSSADRGPCRDHARLCLASSCLFPANRENESSCASAPRGARLSRIESRLSPLPSSRWLSVLSSRIARRVRKNRHAATNFSACAWVRADGNGSASEGKTGS